MAQQVQSLQDLLGNELQDLFDAEQHILKALPKMQQAASSNNLKQAFQMHEQQTQHHVQRLEQVFSDLGMPAKGKTCIAMQGIIREGEKLMQELSDPAVKDAGLIAAAQKVEHYEIASYGTVRTWAKELGQQNVANLLQQTLDEEGAANQKLTKIAESGVNVRAEQK